ncbi:MAG TPA: DUF433 domain-containing protein [Thermoanaerobaculia bacterium]|nr:DUF433 domain-containing protein [Thermoanaerobaculia bacterium]
MAYAPVFSRDPRGEANYGVVQVARYLGLSATTLRQWVLGRPYRTKAGEEFSGPLIRLPYSSRPLLSFTNLVEAYVLASLRRKHRIKMHKIREALVYLEQKLGSDHPLATEQLETFGGSLFIRKYGQLLDLPEEGQLAMEEVLRPYLQRIEHDASGWAVRLFPVRHQAEANAPRVVVIDPYVSFGKPTVAGTGVSVAILLDRFAAGESMAALADDYDLDIKQVEEAIRYGLPDELAA